MGQKETASNNNQNPTVAGTETEGSEKNNEEKDLHMIEILKKENDILKKQLESLNKSNKYNTLLSLLEVLEMQRKKIESIKKGNLFFLFNIYKMYFIFR
jgi:hypothetical protein